MSNLIARYTANASGVVPTFNNDYVYETSETESNGVYTVEIYSESDFTSCSFINKTNLLTIDYLAVTSNVTNMSKSFRNCQAVTSINTEGWDTSNVTNMSQMFYNCQSLTSLDVSNFDVTKVTSMNTTFSNCQALTSLDVSNWDTSEVTDISNMFQSCHSLTSLDLSNFNIGNVSYAYYVFDNCESLSSLNISNWNTSNIVDMEAMFQNCKSLSSLNISNWNISNVENMCFMFYGCDKLTSLNVSKWNTSNVTDMYCMFDSCQSLSTLDLSNWTINNTCVTDAMLSGCSARTIYMYDSDYASVNRIIEQLPQVDNAELYIGGIDSLGSVNLSGARAKNWSVINKYKVAKYKFDKSIYESLIPVFNDGYTGYTISDEIDSENENHVIRTILGNSLPTRFRFGYTSDNLSLSLNEANSLIDVLFIDISNSNNLGHIFCNCQSLKSVNTSNWDTSHVGNMGSMFDNCFKLTSLDVSNWDTSNVTAMNHMFSNCQSLTSLDVSNFDTSKVNAMHKMFSDCYSLTSLDVSNWDTSNVTAMNHMFYQCHNLTSLDVSKWNTGNVTDMNNMFNNCRSLTSLDVSNWDTSNVTLMNHMFYGCKALTTLDVSKWNTSNVTNMTCLFDNCQSLTSLDVSNWDTSNVTDMHAMFSDLKNIKSLDISNFDTSKVTNMINMFDGKEYGSGINILNINNLNMDLVVDYKEIFLGSDNLEKVYINNIDTLIKLQEFISNRIGKEPGYIVTSIRDQIDEETMAALAAKNWQIKDLVAQYRFDAKTYENLMPEFNPEFTSDKYEIHDSVSEIVIDGFKWENGSIHNTSGSDVLESEDNENQFFINYRKSDFVPVIGNVELNSNYRINSIIYYDESKKYIGYNSNTATTDIILPNNTKYIRLTVHKDNTPDYDNLTLTAKLVTRSIESKNGDLPTVMRFGHNGDPTDDYNTYTGPATSLLKVLAANTNELTTGQRMFRYCKRVEEIRCSNWNTSNMIDMGSMFATASDCLTELDVSNFDVSSANSISTMFWCCFNLTTLDVSNWDTSNVNNMQGVFRGSNKLNNIIGMEDWDTGNVKYMNFMFAYCYNLQSLDLSKWNVDNVIDMEKTFCDCTSLGLLNLSSWNMNNVTNIDNIIYGCNKLNSIIMYNSNAVSINKIINQLPTRTEASKGALVIAGVDDRTLVNVTVAESKFWIVKSNLVAKYKFNKSIYDNFLPDMGTDFTSYTVIDEANPYNANHITRMIVSDSAPQIMKFGADGDDYTKSKALMEVIHVHMDNLRWCYNMFRGCQYATAINLKNVNTDLMTNMTCMFSMCYNITTLDVSSFNTSQVTDMMFVFDDCNKLTEIKGLENWDVGNVTSFSNMFENCAVIKTIPGIENWETGNVINMIKTFGNCKALTTLDISGWDTSNVTDMHHMFYECNALKEIDVSNWETGNVTNIEHMFYGTTSITGVLDLNNWDTSKVTNMSSVFQFCHASEIKVSNWDTSNVTDMGYMFNSCYLLTSLDVSNFNTSKVTTMNSMFHNCKNLTSLDVSNFNTSNVINMGNMFYDCSNLTSLDVSNFDTGNVTNMYQMFRNCYRLTSLDVSRWNVSKVANMQNMFCDCQQLRIIDVSNWDTSSLVYGNVIFQSCHNIKSLDLSNWKYDNMTESVGIVAGCYLLNTINLNNFKLPNYDIMDFSPEVKVIYLNMIENLVGLLPNLHNRTGLSSGQIITTLRDQIDEETMAALAAKNWQIKDLVAQYRFDANTYEDLMPEFNPEFTEDMYEVHDSVNEIVIDDIVLEVGAINGESGTDINSDAPEFTASTCNRTNYLSIIPNTTYSFNYEHDNMVMFDWYDENKKFISQEYIDYNEFVIASPINAKYLRMWSNNRCLNEHKNTLTAKLVTRSIESVNGDLPTLMRFGNSNWDIRELREQSLLKVIDLNGKNLTNTCNMFNNCHRLCKLNVHNLITANVTNTSLMFHECKLLKFIDVDKFDMINVTNTWGMFQGCYNLTSLDVSNFNTSNVTNMGVMFYDCNNLTSLDVSNWDTSKVTNMSGMFAYCEDLTSLDVSGFNTNNVTDMSLMFAYCNNLTSLDVSNWDTGNVTDMNNMFYNCNNLTTLDVSNWDTSKVTNMCSMFHNCKKLTTVDVSRWNVGNVIRMDNLFNSCNELVSIDVSNWNTSNVQNMGCLFGWCFKLQSVDLSNWDTGKVTDMSYMFSECIELTSIGDTSNWDTGKVTDMSYMFHGCINLTSLDVSNFDTGKVTDMHQMFYYCEQLTSLDVSGFDTRNVTDMGGMFAYCRKLTSLDVSNFDTSNVTVMDTLYNIDATSTIREGMFCNCNSLTSLDVSKWDTSKVTDMGGMFWGCSNLTSLDVSNFDTSNVTSLTNMFDDCINLTRIEGIENWIVDNVNNFNTIFNDCWKLRNLDLSRWNVKHEAQFTGTFTSNYGPFVTMNLVYLDIRNWEIDETNIYYTDKTTGEPVRRPIIADRNTQLKYIRNDVASTVDWLASNVLTRTADDPGYIITEAVVSNETIEAFAAKNWNVVRLADMNTVDIAIYKFDKSVYKSLVPVFDNNFADYFIDDVVEDEVNAPNIVTRTIRSMGGLPTHVRFGDISFNEDTDIKNKYNSLRVVNYVNTSNCVTLAHMFRGCMSLTNINDVACDSNINDIDYICYHCAELTSLDVSNWDTSNVTNMHGMFDGCYKITSLDVSNWDTRNVTSMGAAFAYCLALSSLDVSNWDTSNVTHMHYMFNTCQSLTSIDVSGFDTSNVINISHMFANCNNLTSLDVSGFDTSKATDMAYMFSGCNKLTSLDVSDFNTSKVTDMSFMFNHCESLTSLDVSNFNTSNATYINTMFNQCNNLTSLDVSKWDTSKAVGLNYMFNNCKSLTSLDVSNWDTSNMKHMLYVFNDCKSLTSLDVSNWDTSNVTLMEGMFAHCESLKELNLSNFKTDKVSNIASWMFTGLISLTSLDISNFKLNWSSDILINVNRTIADIGMVYCDFKTIENMAKSIPTSNPTTIWVGNHIDFNALPQYDHITYKVYEVEDKLEVELSSPLLEGDRLEIIDGDLYHYHKSGTELLDGRHYYAQLSEVSATGRYFYAFPSDSHIKQKPASECIADIIQSRYFGVSDGSVDILTQPTITVNLNGIGQMRLYVPGISTLDGYKNWLKANPVTIIYELANPYYELVKPNVGLLNAEQGLYLNISDSVVPVVNHQDLCTLKLNYLLPNVEYKVKFKANNPGSIAINLGGTLVPLDVVEGWNEVMVTTPETLVDEYLKVNGSEGIKIQNVMVIDSNKDFDYFKGMNNTFDEIPVKNICTNRTLTYTHGVDEEGVSPQGEMNVNVSKGKVVTVIGKVSNNPDNLPISINLYNDTGRATGKNLFNKEWFEQYVLEGGDQEYLDKGYVKFNYTHAHGKDFNINYAENTQYKIDFDIINIIDQTPDAYGKYQANARIDVEYTDGSIQLVWSPTLTHANKTIKRIYFTYGYYAHTVYIRLDDLMIYKWKGYQDSEYEPPEFNVNANPIFINPDENGYFAITIRADRDYANRIGFNVGDAFACEENDQVTITDLMVFEGDILDCQPTTYVDPADTRYLVEYKSIGNPFGFGKNKLI